MLMNYPVGFGQAVDISVADAPVSPPSRGIFIGVGGNLTVVMADGGQTVTFTNLAAGVIHAIRVKSVVKSTTTATGILALR